jgi:predicted O-methyltransferase YrrM
MPTLASQIYRSAHAYAARMFAFPDSNPESLVTFLDFPPSRYAEAGEEAIALMERVGRLRPKVILEIGTAGGGSLVLLCRAAPPDATIITVDLPHHSGGYHWTKVPLYRSFARSKQKLHLVRGDSHSSSTLAALSAHLLNREVDFLLIDGDNGYDGVKRDFSLYSSLVRPGGVIAFHDIRPHFREDIKVDRLWCELTPRYRHEELIADPTSNGYGIGLLYV